MNATEIAAIVDAATKSAVTAALQAASTSGGGNRGPNVKIENVLRPFNGKGNINEWLKKYDLVSTRFWLDG